jgi:hypothetical protein
MYAKWVAPFGDSVVDPGYYLRDMAIFFIKMSYKWKV